MAVLPDPRNQGDPEVADAIDRMAKVRADSDGRAELGQVYIAMFNNPAVAERVGALGEYIRFEGCLPDRVREIAILRFSFLQGMRYEWAHHVRPATLAGLDQSTIDSLAEPEVSSLTDGFETAALRIVEHVARGESIPAAVQAKFAGQYGDRGVVELVTLCGLYSLIGYTAASFDIEIEPGLPEPPF